MGASLMWIEGVQYQLMRKWPDGGEVWEPVQEVVSVIGIDEVPAPVAINSTSVSSSVVRTGDQSSAFRTNRGGSVIR